MSFLSILEDLPVNSRSGFLVKQVSEDFEKSFKLNQTLNKIKRKCKALVWHLSKCSVMWFCCLSLRWWLWLGLQVRKLSSSACKIISTNRQEKILEKKKSQSAQFLCSFSSSSLVKLVAEGCYLPWTYITPWETEWKVVNWNWGTLGVSLGSF